MYPQFCHHKKLICRFTPAGCFLFVFLVGSLGFIVSVIFFVYVTVYFCFNFFSLNIDVVTLYVHGWCMLGVFVAGIHLYRAGVEHICLVLLSLSNQMHACATRPALILSSKRIVRSGAKIC